METDSTTPISTSRSWRRGPVGITLLIISVTIALIRFISSQGGTSYSSGSYSSEMDSKRLLNEYKAEQFKKLFDTDYENWSFSDKLYIHPFGNYSSLMPELVLATFGEPISSSNNVIEYDGLAFTFAPVKVKKDNILIKSIRLTDGEWLIDRKFGIGSSFDKFKAAVKSSKSYLDNNFLANDMNLSKIDPSLAEFEDALDATEKNNDNKLSEDNEESNKLNNKSTEVFMFLYGFIWVEVESGLIKSIKWEYMW